MADDVRAGRRVAVETAADALVEALRSAGVELIFANLGTDHPPLIETLAKFHALGRLAPKVIQCPHESVALSAAHGFAQVTGRPQVVLVHVDAGTANLGGAVHNAARSRIPVLILAGRTPFTDRGELKGSRDSYVQFLQDIYDQSGIVRPYVKWEYELHRGANIGLVVQRALRLAAAEPGGPVYLTAPREVLEEPLDAVDLPDPASSPPPVSTIPDGAALRQIAQWLRAAERPVVVTSYIGRRAAAVSALVALADQLALPVAEMLPRAYMNFPTDHPLYLGAGWHPRLGTADLVLVVDCDVPWIPSAAQPPAGARIIHLDLDPVKENLPLWMFPAHLSARVDAAATLSCLVEELRLGWTADVEARVGGRRRALDDEAGARRSAWRDAAPPPPPGGPITAAWLTRWLGDILPREAIAVTELVTHAPETARHLPRSLPGSLLSAGGASLGWGLGASIGVKLARPEAEVVCLVGDGSFLFGVPSAALWTSRQYHAPFLAIIYNNKGWAAAKDATRRQHPSGYAVRAGEFLSSFGEGVDFAAIAAGAGGYGERVVRPEDVPAAVGRARRAVREGQTAVLDVAITPV
jgi:acetolactate synthase-1/2/3 large subunit